MHRGFDIKNRLVGIHHFPYHHRADQNRVALLVIHFDYFRFQIPHPKRNLLLIVEGIEPVKSIRFHGTLILTKEDQYPCLIWGNGKQSGKPYKSGEG